MALFKNKLPQPTILMVEVGRTSNASVASLHPRSVLIKPAVSAVGPLNAQRVLITLTLMIRDPPAAIEMGAPPPAKIAPQGRNYFDIFAI